MISNNKGNIYNVFLKKEVVEEDYIIIDRELMEYIGMNYSGVTICRRVINNYIKKECEI